MSCDSFDLDRLRESIRPLRLHWFARLGSTNRHAARMRRARRLFAPALVLTGHQTAGRGRGGNTWWSNYGCITATLVVATHDDLSLHQLPLIAGLALRNAVAEITGHDGIQLKWPNDLICNGRKLAGLLCEQVGGVDLVGMGLNVNLAPSDLPPPLRGRTTSLLQITGEHRDKTEVLSHLVRRLHTTLSRRNEYAFGSILREYDRYHCLRGRRVSVRTERDTRPVRGICRGLDALGRLLVVRNSSEKFRIVSGHVQVR